MHFGCVSSLAAVSLIFGSSIGFERLMKFLWDGVKAEVGLECCDTNATAIIPTAPVVPVTGTFYTLCVRLLVEMWPSFHQYRYI